MKNRLPLIVIIAGLAAAAYAILLNLVTATPDAAQAMAMQGVIFAVIALGCGVYTFRRGGSGRFLSIAMIGPAVFVLSDSSMRLLFLLTHK